ncbi:MAG: hypothetical protein ACO1OX_01320 [Novosphingobium sp.]
MHMLTTHADTVAPAQAGAHDLTRLVGRSVMDPGLRRGDDQEFQA